jgi:hypothetical protein
VIKTSLRRFGGWKKIFEATLEESQPNALSEPLVCRWFNLHYVQKMIATGQRIVVFGRPRLRGKRICMDHPEFEVIENDEEISIHFRRITPIYPATEGLSQRVLRGIIYRVLQESPDAGWQPIAPPSLVHGERSDAIRAIHFPGSWEARDAAREHLRAFGILCDANAGCVAAFRVIHPRRPGTLRVRRTAGQILEGTSLRIDRGTAKSGLRNPSRSGGELSHEPFVTGRRRLGKNRRRDCGDASCELKRDIRPRSWRRRKFWPSNITKYCGVGSSRWASASHYEQQQGRKKAVHCRFSRR